MSSIGNNRINKVFLGTSKVKKILVGNDVVFQDITVTPTRLTLQGNNSPVTVSIPVYKTDSTETVVELKSLQDVTVTSQTISTSGLTNVSITTTGGLEYIYITGGEWYLNSYCLGSASNNALLYGFRPGTSYGSIIGSNAFRSSNIVNVDLRNTNITTINNRAFQACSSLTTIALPLTVTSIPSNCFRDCTSLVNIQMAYNITSIGQYAFYNCAFPYIQYRSSSLTMYGILPPAGTVTSIGSYAFAENSQLSIDPTGVMYDVILRNNISSMSASTFENCSKLKSALIEVGTIYQRTFNGCSQLSRVVLSNTLYIFGECFGDTALTELVIPSTIIQIGQTSGLIQTNLCIVGSNYSSLNYIRIEKSTPPVLVTPQLIPDDVPIQIPAGSLSAYTGATNWSSHASQFVEYTT